MIFYKGCPLRCQWCSNPESFTFGYSIMYDRKRCKNFGDCIGANHSAIRRINGLGVEIDRSLIQDPEMLRDICPSRALIISGESMSVDELLVEIEKDIPFYREDGGVTLSGGEPLSQGEELILLIQALQQKNIRVNVETSLHVEWSQLARTFGLVNTYLVDLKHVDAEKFKSFTEGDLSLGLCNLKKLFDAGEDAVIRIPVIPGFNHTLGEMKQIIDYIAALRNTLEVHFLPYHTLGTTKYEMLGMEYTYGSHRQVQEKELEPYVAYAESKDLQAKIGG